MSNQYLRIEEVEGSDPISLTLSGGALPSREGLAFETKQTGSKHIPIGSKRATQAVSGIEHLDTEMKLYVEVPFIGPGDVRTANAQQPRTPEDLADTLRRFQERGRQLQVSLGAYVRIGRLAGCKVEPTRGNEINFLGLRVPPGMNAEVTLTFEWSRLPDEKSAAQGVLAGPDLAGSLAAVSAKMSTLLSPDAWAEGVFDKIRDGISSVLSSIEGLKNLCRRVNSLVTAPARLANALLAAAKGAAKALSELDDILTRTPDEDLAPYPGFVVMVRAKRAAGDLRANVGDGMAAVVAVFDALASRRAREVGVRPGESLALVAKRELGSADRWPAIAALNEIAGQVVPPATFIVEVPGA